MDTDIHGSEPELTEAVIGAAFEVVNLLGAGFLERVYEKALIRELALLGVKAKAQVPIGSATKASTWASISATSL